MKFTKQEQSLIKLAAAHMAPQMLKKATLQDKLAEYGIGMNKKALDLGEIELSDKALTPVAAGGQPAPRIGKPAPYNFAKKDDWDKQVGPYPYFGGRFLQGMVSDDPDESWRNALLFDRALRTELNQREALGGRFTQGAVDRARGAQAQELAARVAKPGTDAYTDAVQMLIQAGKNNQEVFETKERSNPQQFDTQDHNSVDRWSRVKPREGTPRGYFGPNRLNDKTLDLLRKYYPVMGSTGNFRRFSNLS